MMVPSPFSFSFMRFFGSCPKICTCISGMNFPLHVQPILTNMEQSLKDNVEDYIGARVDIMKLKAAHKAGSAISGVVLTLILARLGLFAIIFLSFSGAYALSEATDR